MKLSPFKLLLISTLSLVSVASADRFEKENSGVAIPFFYDQAQLNTNNVSVELFGASEFKADNSAELNRALSAAKKLKKPLYFPAHNYRVQKPLRHFHKVKKVGPGRILTDKNIYCFDKALNATNVIYVSPRGSAENDGLSESSPINIDSINSILESSGPILYNKWVIKLLPGTYKLNQKRPYILRLGPDNEIDSDPDSENYTKYNLATPNYISLEGVDVGYDPVRNSRPAPRVIFDGLGKAGSGIDIRGGIKAYVKDIKFVNFNGSASSSGLLCAEGALRCENVHTSNCYHGISALEHCVLEVKGGYIYGDKKKKYIGIRSLFGVKHDIGSQGIKNLRAGPVIEACHTGFIAQESSTGHADFVTFKNCSIGIHTVVNARVNANGSEFDGCSVALRASGNGHIVYHDNANFKNIARNAVLTQTFTGGQILCARRNASPMSKYTMSDKCFFLKTTFNKNSSAVDIPILSEYLFSNPSPISMGKMITINVYGEMAAKRDAKEKVRLIIAGNTIADFPMTKTNGGVFKLTVKLYVNNNSILAVAESDAKLAPRSKVQKIEFARPQVLDTSIRAQLIRKSSKLIVVEGLIRGN